MCYRSYKNGSTDMSCCFWWWVDWAQEIILDEHTHWCHLANMVEWLWVGTKVGYMACFHFEQYCSLYASPLCVFVCRRLCWRCQLREWLTTDLRWTRGTMVPWSRTRRCMEWRHGTPVGRQVRRRESAVSCTRCRLISWSSRTSRCSSSWW